MNMETRSSGNDMAHDHVFLEAPEIIHFAHGGRFRQHTRRVLEGGGAQETLGLQRGLRDAQ